LVSLPPKIQRAFFLGLACLALAVRLPRLSERPMHTDEAVNAYITGEMLAGHPYPYDPQDRHGPVLCLLAEPVARLAGVHDLPGLTETTVRLVPAIVGALTVLLFGALAGAIGFVPTAIGASLFAFAPLPVYYSRYFIHETLFVAATLGLMTSAWLAARKPTPLRGALAGLWAGVMLACKETALLHFAAMGAAGIWWAWHLYRRGKIAEQPAANSRVAVTIGSAVAAFVVLVLSIYSWEGRDWQGAAKLFGSGPRLAARAAGEGHEKPADYYLKVLGDSGAGYVVLALAVFGAIAVLRRRSGTDGDEEPGAKVLLIYAVSITLIYSAIPYKVPWLALNLWLPITLLAGLGFAALWQAVKSLPGRGALIFGSGILLGWLGLIMWQRVFVDPANERNPYAYAHTSEDLLRLPDRVAQLAATAKSPSDFRVAVIAADPWPLPWYLRHIPQVGYWQPGQDPGPATIYVTSMDAAESLQARLANWRPEFFGARPGVLLMLWTPPDGTDGHE
jgi:uncharacterized protein (TIGR03663 family)